jgi:pimeloyl-ACP methyl ester carboxylesterase
MAAGEGRSVPWSLTGSIPGARFAAIDGAAHFPMVEKPEETARLLSEFLD